MGFTIKDRHLMKC